MSPPPKWQPFVSPKASGTLRVSEAFLQDPAV